MILLSCIGASCSSWSVSFGLLVAAPTLAQTDTIEGTVRDADGEQRYEGETVAEFLLVVSKQ